MLYNKARDQTLDDRAPSSRGVRHGGGLVLAYYEGGVLSLSREDFLVAHLCLRVSNQ